MNNDESLDLLDLDNGTSMDTLPTAPVLSAPRPKKPWLLLGVGLLVIILATYIIIRTIGDDTAATIEVDLDAPVAVVGAEDNAPLIIGDEPVDIKPAPVAVPQPVQAAPQPVVVPQPAPVAAPKPAPVAAKPVQATPGVPVRVVEDRKAVAFNPEKPAAKPAAAPVKKATAPVKKAAPKPTVAPKGSWYVQLGSYSTNASAQAAQRKIVSAHSALFAGHQPVILAAVLPNGTTTYRLRVPFKTSKDANGFCQNAKSDGLDCYVAK